MNIKYFINKMEKAKIYFYKLDDLDKLKSDLPKFKKKLAVKTHFGEPGNTAYIPPKIVQELTSDLGDFDLIETTVLYKSPRQTAKGHKQVGIEHGFNFAPIEIIDGEMGDEFVAKKINGKHFKECYLGKGIDNYDSILVVSHFKGHISAGFGGALKNLAMGIASRKGKLHQHASVKHDIDKEKCISCGLCIENCPVSAIKFNDKQKAVINDNLCISCSKCMAVCPEGAVNIPWDSTEEDVLKERIAEYALATSQGLKCYYVNFLINIVEGCDCMAQSYDNMTEDIGILISSDPVAIDQASFDLVTAQCPKFKELDGQAQLDHGANIGLGSKEYELINK